MKVADSLHITVGGAWCTEVAGSRNRWRGSARDHAGMDGARTRTMSAKELDRLVKELRLRKTSTPEAGNACLPAFEVMISSFQPELEELSVHLGSVGDRLR